MKNKYKLLSFTIILASLAMTGFAAKTEIGEEQEPFPMGKWGDRNYNAIIHWRPVYAYVLKNEKDIADAIADIKSGAIHDWCQLKPVTLGNVIYGGAGEGSGGLIGRSCGNLVEDPEDAKWSYIEIIKLPR